MIQYCVVIVAEISAAPYLVTLAALTTLRPNVSGEWGQVGNTKKRPGWKWIWKILGRTKISHDIFVLNYNINLLPISARGRCNVSVRSNLGPKVEVIVTNFIKV